MVLKIFNMHEKIGLKHKVELFGLLNNASYICSL